jgi:hypothetical protein
MVIKYSKKQSEMLVSRLSWLDHVLVGDLAVVVCNEAVDEDRDGRAGL